MKKCMYCAEEIQNEAVICKHCGSDLSAPPPVAMTSLKEKLETAIGRYVARGYQLNSRTDISAILQRRAPINPITLIAWLILFWPVALFYAFGGRKEYRVQLSAASDGQISELGGTLAEYERDQKRAKRIGWILLGIIVVVMIILIVSALSS